MAKENVQPRLRVGFGRVFPGKRAAEGKLPAQERGTMPTILYRAGLFCRLGPTALLTGRVLLQTSCPPHSR